MAKAKPVHVATESEIIVANEEYSSRFADLQKSMRRPVGSPSLTQHIRPEVLPRFEDEEGRRYLVENSANTGTFVRFQWPQLVYEARNAMEWAQQAREE
jgi:hypothetical protein